MLAVRFTMEKFKELFSLCKGSVEITVNGHKDYCETVEEHISEENGVNINDDVLAEMVKRDTVVRIIAYPFSTSSSFVLYHYNIDRAVEIALDVVKKHTNNR
jgi:hypothetical protein